MKGPATGKNWYYFRNTYNMKDTQRQRKHEYVEVEKVEGKNESNSAYSLIG